jgi:hypothetical protein
MNFSGKKISKIELATGQGLAPQAEDSPKIETFFEHESSIRQNFDKLMGPKMGSLCIGGRPYNSPPEATLHRLKFGNGGVLFQQQGGRYNFEYNTMADGTSQFTVAQTAANNNHQSYTFHYINNMLIGHQPEAITDQPTTLALGHMAILAVWLDSLATRYAPPAINPVNPTNLAPFLAPTASSV